MGDVPSQERRRIFLYIDFFFELRTVQFHVFVRVPRVAVLAGELASSIGIDGPLERHAVRIAPVQDRLHGQ